MCKTPPVGEKKHLIYITVNVKSDSPLIEIMVLFSGRSVYEFER